MNWTITSIITTVLIMIAVYGFFIEPCQVRLKTVKIRNKSLASAFTHLRIVLLSDLHIGTNWSISVKRALKIINKVKPDLILLTGDFLEWKGNKDGYDNAIEFLSQLSAPFGVYAVRGDADCFVSSESCELCHKEGSIFPITKHRVKFLSNSEVFLENRGNKFAIIGIRMDSKNDTKLSVINKLLTEVPSIILTHTSLVYNYIDSNKNVLILSGDTHGGQVYLPKFIWKILKIKPDPAHMYGLYQLKNKLLYVTSGIGTSTSLPIRIGVPPEVVLFEFEE